MKRIRWLRGVVLFTVLILVSSLAAQTRRGPERLPPPQPQGQFTPKFEALAETSLLMQGLAQSNYRALEKHLEGKGPPDVDTWTFARGQALLIAETGNLLLLRPPRNEGRETWMRRAMDMRQAAGDLARQLGNRNLQRSRAAFQELTTQCNRCHQSFRVPTRIGPNREPEEKDGGRDTE
jgi:Cytochrome C'